MSQSAEHAHHPNADHSVEFKGLAAYAANDGVKPWAYNPPKLDDDYVEIDIHCCGICGSDIHVMDSGWFPTTYPQIVGHEIVGKVTAVGSKVTNVKVGDRIGVGAQCGACLNTQNNCPECGEGWENQCRHDNLWTYSTKRKDGQITQGGYADRIRLQSAFAFRIPDEISSQEAAPLMCGGVTVFAPLQRYMTRPNMKVGIIGIGGLGHMGVMFASKLQNSSAEVTAISHNSKKKDEALKMGATRFLDTSDKEAVKEHFRYFDLIVCTANGSDMQIAEWINLVKRGSTWCLVGAPEKPIQLSPMTLLGTGVHICGSGIGNIKEIEQMLEFAAKNNVRPIIERLPMEKANEGIQRVRDGTVRFRVVLENTGKQ